MALLKNTTILGDLKVLNGPISNNGQPVVLDNDPRLIDAQTLNKQPASYYLNYNNLTNTPTDLATTTWVQNTAIAHQAASTTGTLTFTGASTATFNGNNNPVVHIPNDAITFSTDPTAKGQILRSMTIGDTTWIIAGTDNNIGVTYEEI